MTCTSCGVELGSGQFCANCGHPVRPPTRLPPPAPADLPPTPRFRMFADEAPPAQPPPSAPPPAPMPPAPRPRRTVGPWATWLVVVVVLALVGVLGGWLLLRSDGNGSDTATDPRPSEPTRDPSGSPGPAQAEPGVVVPVTAPPNQDVDGNPVRYDGDNLLDGDPETCWRMPGDGTGAEITVTLDEKSRLRSVGIVNGYAKTADVDWYHGNRRVLRVEWVFDDGTTVVQSLDDTTELQSVDVDATTTTVIVRLLEVSAPGKGPQSRDFTAISELSIVGR